VRLAKWATEEPFALASRLPHHDTPEWRVALGGRGTSHRAAAAHLNAHNRRDTTEQNLQGSGR